MFYSKYFIYPVFFLTFIVLYSAFSNYFQSLKGNLRLLAEDDGLKEICKKDEVLYKYYYENGDYEINDPKLNEINTQSEIILKYIKEDFDSKYIFEYLGHSGTYIFFVILLIIIILLTIYYTFASCIRICTDKCCNLFSCSCCKNKCFKRTVCILIPVVYLIVFILALISLALAVFSIDKFSGAVCIGLQFVDSLLIGEQKPTLPKWGGISTVSKILEDLADIAKENNEDLVENIYKSQSDYNVKKEEWQQNLIQSYSNHYDGDNPKYISVKNPKMSISDEEKDINISPFYAYNWGPYDNDKTILGEIYYESKNEETITNVLSTFDEYLYKFLGCEKVDNEMKCIGESPLSKILLTGSDIIQKIKEPVDNVKEKISKPINNIYDKVNSTVISIFSVILVFVIFYSIVIETLLSIFCCSNKCQCKCCSCCMKWLLCFIYYTSIFIVILGFIIGIVVGFLGSFVQNAARVVQDITSSSNLNSPEPNIFGKNGFTKYLDVCLNGDGRLYEELNLTDNFEIIDNITEISNDTSDLANETYLETSPIINQYKQILDGLKTNYLDFDYYDINDKSNYIIKDKIDEINKYVSGEFYSSEDSCMRINENWNTNKEIDGYSYDGTYPSPTQSTNYLIYLYDDNIYSTANLESRYDGACPTKNHPYETVSEASKAFGTLFNSIGVNIADNKFQKAFIDDLDNLNQIYGQKNKYLQQTMKSATGIISQIGKTFSEYSTGKNHISSLLNCRFVGNNKMMLIDTLYTSLGTYLEAFGILTIMFSLFIFLGIISIIIITRNNDPDDKNSSINIETLNDILTGKSDFQSPGSLLDSSEA